MVLRMAVSILPWPFFVWWLANKSDQKWKGAGASVVIRDVVVALCGFAAAAFSVSFAGEGFFIKLLSAEVTSLVIAFSAREDLRCGKIYVYPLLACVGINLPLAAISCYFERPSGAYVIPLWKEILVVLVIILALWFARLAIGDAGLYLACWLSFLVTFRGSSFLAFFLVLLASTVFGIFSWIYKVVRGMKAGARFPFSAQIFFGYVLACVAFGFLW